MEWVQRHQGLLSAIAALATTLLVVGYAVAWIGNVATKDDIATIKDDIATIRTEMSDLKTTIIQGLWKEKMAVATPEPSPTPTPTPN